MPKESEAACLLRSGTTFPDRIGIVDPSGRPIFVGFRPGAASVYFGDEPIFHFDHEGRWQRAFVGGTHYLRALDGTVRVLNRSRVGENLILQRRTLSFADGLDLDSAARSAALEIAGGLDDGWETLGPPEPARRIDPGELRGFLDRVASWDSAAWFAHRERYLGLYGPPPFHPPEAASAILLQATLGHAGPVFGGAEPEPFYRRSPEEFEEHARGVARLWGRRIEQAKGVYLAGSDLWHEPVESILGRLSVSGAAFPCLPAIGFLDDFNAPLPGLEGWRTLREAGLKTMTLGVEAADSDLRTKLGKTWTDWALTSVVADLVAASIACRVVVLEGLGRDALISPLLAELPLVRGSILYFVDIREINPDRWEPEPGGKNWREGPLAEVLRARGIKLSPYSLDKRWS